MDPRPPRIAAGTRCGACLQDMDAAYERAAAAHGFVCSGCSNQLLPDALSPPHPAGGLVSARRFQRVADRRERIRANAAAVAAPAAEQTRQVSGGEARAHVPARRRGALCALRPPPDDVPPARDPARAAPPRPLCAAEPRLRRVSPALRPAGPAPSHRTPLYTELARLEAECRQALGLRRKIRMTVAEIPPDGGGLS